MPPDVNQDDMEHLQSTKSSFAAVPKALSPRPEMAWTVSDASSVDTRIVTLDCNMLGRVEGKSLIFHSAALSRLIRDIINVYPGQNLTGDALVFREPYAALLHHMSDIETTYMAMTSEEENSTTKHTQLSHALSTLLDFLRPIYQECYVPAQMRLSQEQPTVTFDDLWILLRPNSLAYAEIDGHWIGCKVGPSVKWPADSTQRVPAKWQVGIWYLQTDFSTEKIGCAAKDLEICDYDGELSPSKLKIIPCQFYDHIDGGSRRKALGKSGQKVLDILWGSSRQYKHSGRSLSAAGESRSQYSGSPHPGSRHTPTNMLQFTGDVLVAGTGDHDVAESCIWIPKWFSPSHVLPKEDPAYHALVRKIDPKTDSCDLFTGNMRIMLSPCLHVISLWKAKLHVVHVDNLQSPNLPEFLPEPIIHHNQLHNIISLTERPGVHGSVLRGNSNDGNHESIIINLYGGVGVGKTYTANYVSWKTGRPLISISVYDFHDIYRIEEQEQVLTQISKTHNAMILLQFSVDPHISSSSKNLIPVLRRLNTVVFLISRGSHMITPFLPFVQLVVEFTPLDYKRQKKMWLHMMDVYRSRRDMKTVVDFEKGASIFLSSADMPKVRWNGHDIMKCLRMAVSSAQAAWNSTHFQKDDNRTVVKIEHLKHAMNMAFATRSAAPDTIARGKSVAMPPGRLGIAKKVPRISTGHFDDDCSDDLLLDFGHFHDYDELSDDDESLSLSPKERRKTKLGLSNVRSRKLCIATLNEVEWSTFKTLGTTELFRSKRFHAIDVLVGEPQIWREFPGILGHKRRIPTQDLSAPRPIAAETTRQQNASGSPANPALPERIRVNSPAIIKAFLELRVDDSSNLRGSFLLFRPYKVLSYYEKDLRDWTEKLEDTAKANREQPERVDEDHDEDLQADVAEMKCLLSFIDTYLKEREERIKSALVQSVTFDDLWFLFKPGDPVVQNDIRQAYRIVRVATTRHHIKQHTNTSLSFFRDDALVEFDQRHIFIQCVHIDFDGRLLGPVLDVFPIAYFKGERAISSLPIYPIEFSKNPETSKEFLIKRGRSFAKAGTIGHMHYKGLTLPAIESSRLRDEVDSQVVIDFEEAFNRFPEWMPPVKATVLEEGQEESDKDDSSVSSVSDEEEWKPEFRDTQDRSHWKCIPECCSRETVFHDESIDDRTRNDYLTSQANENSTSPSVAIEARILSNSNDILRDDDFLVMSYRVFGFVLRSRKWHQLDLADASPAETNSDGFDQLVLPKGHKDIVTSMITKHFRDRKSSSSRGQTDIVRGKGRGLIMLLHGVPGVGKTSTAECLAGVFNRPLFQITSGDLGITAKDVDENLEENFSLANRWNCILLIDEADVFLAQRNKEDFVQNSLVAVFLRIMEYYSGVLFLTTNRVGVFDEAFSSRIHISLYYPPLDRDQTLEIFKKNWERILARSEEDGRQIDIDLSEIVQFAMDYFDNNKQGRWNGRQIRNAFQSALAMAEFEVLDMDGVKDDQNDVSSGREAVHTVKLGRKHFERVAEAYKGFVDYLKKVHGAGSSRRARENMWRFDDDDESAPKRPTALTQRLKFTGDPMQEPPRNVAPSFGPSQYYRGYGPGHETPSHHGPMNPPRGGYAGSHEYHYPPAAFVPRTHEMEQGLYPDHHRAWGPSVNYPPAQPQTYGTRTHPAPPQHDMQTSQSNWASSSRDAQSGGYSYHRGEQKLGGGAGPNVRWGDDTEAGGSQQGH